MSKRSKASKPNRYITGVNPHVVSPRNSMHIRLCDNFKFGKYKGDNVKEVCINNPQYVSWLIENTTIFIHPEVISFLKK